MSPRTISPWKRPNSAFYWFRMVVPEPYREAIGQREIKESLKTVDIGEARRACILKQQAWLDRFKEIEAGLQAEAATAGVRIVDNFLTMEAERQGGIDRVMAYELEHIALTEDALFDMPPLETLEQSTAVDAAITRLRWDALRHNPRAALLPGIEATERALSTELWEASACFLEEAFASAGLELVAGDPRMAVAARHFLRRLLDHPQPGLTALREALPTPGSVGVPIEKAPEIAVPAIPQQPEPPRSEIRNRLLADAAKASTISEVFAAWSAAQPPEAAKLIDEWGTSIRRFVDLLGDLDVRVITSEMVMDYRDAMAAMPTRPAKRIAALPVLEQIEIAREEGLPTLAGPTVAKHLSAIRVTLDHGCDPLRLLKANVAKGVSAKDAKSAVDARQGFDEDEMLLMFGAARMIDPNDPCSITLFWLVLVAVFSGLRIEEMGKLRPKNIKRDRGIWFFRVEREIGDKDESIYKTAKTINALRDVPVHWLLTEAGFLDFAAHQKARGCEWLFEGLDVDKYGNRTKRASRLLVDWMRGLGIADKTKVFHSYRHTVKRACRNTSMKEEIADLLAGHAPSSVGRKYGAGAALDVLRDAVDMIEYPAVDWDAVIACARTRVSRHIATGSVL